MKELVKSLSELVDEGVVQLTRGKIISKKDIAACPGNYPVYSSAKEGDGRFGEYGRYMFDEELITWSVDGGGKLFHRPKHRFSVTNVGGVLRILQAAKLDYKYLYYALTLRHSETTFDWVKKAHPSVIKKLYVDIPLPPLPEQRRIVALLDEAFAGLTTAQANAEKNLQNARALFESHLNDVFSKRGEGWVEKRLGEVCEFRGGGTPSKAVAKYWQGDIPWVSPKDMKSEVVFDSQDHVSSEAIENSATNLIPKNAVLMVVRSGILARIVPLAITARDLTINQDLKALCPTSAIDARFLYSLLKSKMPV